ncbi:tRNA lysidine(34) synthetase TilS [Advenella mimigardefordensis]|uniref:tRNA(Ile)-lysidine synthase n=1 Tax=Advenella mimigardefordensis (strain DSM 17166 / LMG 22922 / DPN7) TaxID=1247726 RepID=W0PD63_ADVMD|nr:tRNA lysidine(34) synthetase TilS [Advenella mimigardefordensis]AHG63355.1 tRNA(Ile)-lysidine synthase [Advenella mimigardefordensis DPN7]
MPQADGLQDTALLGPLQATLGAINAPDLAIGVSGGADSAMLLVAASQIAAAQKKTIHAVHVHHGLVATADAWALHTAKLAQQLGVAFHFLPVKVPSDTGKGIEAAARLARYSAFEHWSVNHDCHHLLLAHHRDDQAETMLLRLLRGAGVQGMAGMASYARRGSLHLYRPWLDVGRERILQAAACYEAQAGWSPVQDPTNRDEKYTRAAVRTMLTPVLNKRWPQWQGNLLRHARVMAESTLLLQDLGDMDLQQCQLTEDGLGFSLARWRALPQHRQANVLRQWLRRLQIAMPTEARLNQWLLQLRQVHALGHDRNILLKHQGCHIVCRRGQVQVLLDDAR